MFYHNVLRIAQQVVHLSQINHCTTTRKKYCTTKKLPPIAVGNRNVSTNKQINHKGIYYVPIANVQKNIYDVIVWEEYNISRYVLLVSMLFIFTKKRQLHLVSVIRTTNLLIKYRSAIKYWLKTINICIYLLTYLLSINS